MICLATYSTKEVLELLDDDRDFDTGEDDFGEQ